MKILTHIIHNEIQLFQIQILELKEHQFDLQNKSDNETFHRNNLTKASVINLIFSTKNISQYTS